MTYRQGHALLHDEDPNADVRSPHPPLTAGNTVKKSLHPVLKRDLRTLTLFARALKEGRSRGGAVDLSG
eukprot:CAMPEP_0194342244 /NCGR_PEP_ID=MMETSP0171-20130528/92201_1 /TAXON_ID=218684 /ORGANISM="Corethron pennatum, Strain L29A3" /LENGTH=68 /DNA_ID=CAMNT_0039107887 /DNA_START=34 /DNA_END=237 /DNA_ORIENTATION=+